MRSNYMKIRQNILFQRGII